MSFPVHRLDVLAAATFFDRNIAPNEHDKAMR